MPIDHFMLTAGKSMPQNEDAMSALEAHMRDLGSLKNSFFTMENKIVPASVLTSRTLGVSISNDILKMFDFQPVRGRAYATPILSSHRKTNLSTMLKFEGIRIKDSNQINNLLVFGENFFQGSIDDTTALTFTKASKTIFHEIGHAVGAESGINKYPALTEFELFEEKLKYDFEKKKNPISFVTKDVAEEWKNKFINALSDYGVEEARADSFSGLLSRTKLGKSYMAGPDNLYTPLMSPYSYLDSDNRKPFGNYSEWMLENTRKAPFYNALAAHLDFDEIEGLANIQAHGKFMGSLNYR